MKKGLTITGIVVTFVIVLFWGFKDYSNLLYCKAIEYSVSKSTISQNYNKLRDDIPVDIAIKMFGNDYVLSKTNNSNVVEYKWYKNDTLYYPQSKINAYEMEKNMDSYVSKLIIENSNLKCYCKKNDGLMLIYKNEVIKINAYNNLIAFHSYKVEINAYNI